MVRLHILASIFLSFAAIAAIVLGSMPLGGFFASGAVVAGAWAKWESMESRISNRLLRIVKRDKQE